MKPTFKLLLWYMMFLLFGIVMGSCNPVKQVLRDKEKFEQVAREVVKAGYCINDTITITKDSVSYVTKDSLTTDTVYAKCPDFTKSFSNGTQVTSKDGVLSVVTNQKTITKTITINTTHTVRDKKLESILREERDIALDKAAKLTTELDQTKADLKSAKRKNIFTWIGIGVLGLVIVLLKTGILKKFIPFL